MYTRWMQKTLAACLLLMISIGLTACAQKSCCHAEEEGDEYFEEEVTHDPLEPLNRKLFAFHKWFDQAIFRPVAVSYRAVLPPVARRSISNFFSNIDHIPITINNILQFRGKDAANSGSRLLINTTLGIGGLFDVAAPMGFEYRKSDLGQTFARWGWGSSTYVFVPLFGPTTFRDGIGVVGDLYMMPYPYLPDLYEWSAAGLYAVDQRSKFIETEGILAVAALDEYTFIRDGYLVSREAFITGVADGEKGEEGNFGDIL